MARSSAKENARLCTWDRAMPDTGTDRETGAGEQLREGPGGAGDSRLCRRQQRALAAKRASCILGCIKHCVAS